MIRRLVILVAIAIYLGTLCSHVSAAELQDEAVTAAATPVAQNLAQANPFSDVPNDSWAYAAISDLSNSGLIQGYPDGTFRGQRSLTRYEMAVIVDRAATAIQKRLEGGQSVSPADLKTIRDLVDVFGSEIKTIETHVDALDAQLRATQTQTQQNSDQLQQTKSQIQAAAAQAQQAVNQNNRVRVGFAFFNRPGTFFQNAIVQNGPLAAHGVLAGQDLPAGQGGAPLGGSTFGSLANIGPGPNGSNTYTTGAYEHPIDLSDFRLTLAGQIENHINYGVMLESVMIPDGANYLSSSKPAYCLNATPPAGGCGLQDYPFSITTKVDLAWAGYYSVSGLFARIGRWAVDEGKYNGPQLALGGNNVNGLQAGYYGSRFDGWIALLQGNSALTNTVTAPACPLDLQSCATQSGYSFVARADYFFPSIQTAIGASYDANYGMLTQEWNPRAGLCTTGGGTTTVVLPLGNPLGCTAYISAPQLQPNGTVAVSPVTGAYQTTAANIVNPSFWISNYFGNKSRPQFRITNQVLYRVGIDPLTGAPWSGNTAFTSELDFASKGNLACGPLLPCTGKKNSNVGVFRYWENGLNSLSGNGGEGGQIGEYAQFYSGYSGLQNELLSFQHWFSDYVRAGIVFQHYQLASGVWIPAGSASCPGCALRALNANTLYADVYVIIP